MINNMMYIYIYNYIYMYVCIYYKYTECKTMWVRGPSARVWGH